MLKARVDLQRLLPQAELEPDQYQEQLHLLQSNLPSAEPEPPPQPATAAAPTAVQSPAPAAAAPTPVAQPAAAPTVDPEFADKTPEQIIALAKSERQRAAQLQSQLEQQRRTAE